jgi:hypothetical protein
MLYLIDGHNVTGHAPQASALRHMTRPYLCRLVAQWARSEKVTALVVFDGHPPRPHELDRMRFPGLRVEFSGARSADELIEDQLESAADPGRTCVVTSDRAIQHCARRCRCRVLTSVDFVRLLLGADSTTLGPQPGALDPRADTAPPGSPTSPPTDADAPRAARPRRPRSALRPPEPPDDKPAGPDADETDRWLKEWNNDLPDKLSDLDEWQ